MKINISNLEKRFGSKVAVNIDDFSIDSGEILGLVGNNGAGKTTLFRLMLDLIKADQGCVQFIPAHGRINPAPTDPAKSEIWKRFTGAYLDDGFLIDFLTPEEYFAFIGTVNGLSESETSERIAEFAPFMNGEICGQRKLIRNFSAGNKQKIGIIAAMLNRPKLLILDEPFNFLDPTSQNSLKHLLTGYNHKMGATIVISSHNLSHTVDISTRIALLENGVIIKNLSNNDHSAAAELSTYFEGK